MSPGFAGFKKKCNYCGTFAGQAICDAKGPGVVVVFCCRQVDCDQQHGQWRHGAWPLRVGRRGMNYCGVACVFCLGLVIMLLVPFACSHSVLLSCFRVFVCFFLVSCFLPFTLFNFFAFASSCLLLFCCGLDFVLLFASFGSYYFCLWLVIVSSSIHVVLCASCQYLKGAYHRMPENTEKASSQELHFSM